MLVHQDIIHGTRERLYDKFVTILGRQAGASPQTTFDKSGHRAWHGSLMPALRSRGQLAAAAQVRAPPALLDQLAPCAPAQVLAIQREEVAAGGLSNDV